MALVQKYSQMALVQRSTSKSYFGRLTFLKKLFWLYFLLLVFEGALRKWVAPQLSAPLLIVRDPIEIMIIWEAYRTQKFPQRWMIFVGSLTVLLIGLFGLQIVFGGNPLVAGLYGLRSYLLPFPVMFIMGENLDEEDLRKLGACTMWILLSNVLLEVAQYISPADSFLNSGAYEGGAQISYVGGHSRASGTFSFVVGAEDLDTLAAAFIVYGLITDGFAKTWMLWAAAFCLLLSIPMLGSRSVVVQLAAIVGCMGIGAIMGISQFGRVLRVLLPLVIVGFLVSLLPVFSDAMSSMTERFSGATSSEGGSVGAVLIYRTVQPAVDAIERAASSNDWIGIGIGRGAVAVQALAVGTTEAVAGEDEFSREFVEMGPIAGMAFGLFKLFLAIALFRLALGRAREQQPLALLLLPLALSTLFFATPEQPTLGGFMVIGVAFCIAAKLPVETLDQTLRQVMQRQQLLYRRSRVQRR